MSAVYFGWQDTSKHATPETRFAGAVARYVEKHGQAPLRGLCAVSERPTQLPMLASGCDVAENEHVPSGVVMLLLPEGVGV